MVGFECWNGIRVFSLQCQRVEGPFTHEHGRDAGYQTWLFYRLVAACSPHALQHCLRLKWRTTHCVDNSFTPMKKWQIFNDLGTIVPPCCGPRWISSPKDDTPAQCERRR